MIRIRSENINTKEYWNEVWYKGREMPAIYIKRWQVVLSYIKDKSKKIIDVGCGAGWLLSYLREHGCKDLTGTDFSEMAVKRCKELGFNAFVSDCQDMKEIPDNAYDIVICTEVLEHVENPERCFCELYRIARESMIISVPYKNQITSFEHIWSLTFTDLLCWFENIPGIDNKEIDIDLKRRGGILFACFKWRERWSA